MIILYVLIIYLVVALHCLLANIEQFLKNYSSSYTQFFKAFLIMPLRVFLKRYILINDYIFKL